MYTKKQISEKLQAYVPQIHFDEQAGRYRLPGREDWQVSAAVAIVIFPQLDQQLLHLTVRPKTMRDHAGQIALPGGKQDKEDENLIQTAIRECHEEIGLQLNNNDYAGTLPVYEVATGFRIHPQVFVLNDNYPLNIDRNEVDNTFALPFAHLMKENAFHLHQRDMSIEANRHRRATYYAIDYEHYHIWGATAGILLHLATALRQN